MITNPILEAKCKVQKQLNEDAQQNVVVYANNLHRLMIEIEMMYQIKFKYASVQGGYTDICSKNIPA